MNIRDARLTKPDRILNMLNSFVIDSDNTYNICDCRSGMPALNELAIKSPLQEARVPEKDIREISVKADLDIWEKPATSCLLTRIPYMVIKTTLKLVEEAGNMLFGSVYPGTSVSIYGDTALIECYPGFVEKIIKNPQRTQIVSGLKKIGFRYVSLNIECYSTESSYPEIIAT